MAPDRRRLPRARRLTREGELERVRREGRRFRIAHLEVRHLVSPVPYARAAVIVPRYAHTAVERNRVKRRLREIVRLEVLPLLGGVEFTVRALPSAYRVGYEELRVRCAEARERLTRGLGRSCDAC